jgi:thiol-disulfide isomerase/thioredoxin
VSCALAVALLSTVVSACAAASVRTQPTAAQSVNRVGLTRYPEGSRPATPPIAGSTLTGGHFAMSRTKGSVVVINIWASWCRPCRVESPALARASAHFAGRPVRFIGIDEQDATASAKKFVASTGTTYPDLVDSAGRLLAMFTMLPQSAVPSTLVVDRAGRIADRVIGPVHESEINRLVDAALSGR